MGLPSDAYPILCLITSSFRLPIPSLLSRKALCILPGLNLLCTLLCRVMKSVWPIDPAPELISTPHLGLINFVSPTHHMALRIGGVAPGRLSNPARNLRWNHRCTCMVSRLVTARGRLCCQVDIGPIRPPTNGYASESSNLNSQDKRYTP